MDKIYLKEQNLKDSKIENVFNKLFPNLVKNLKIPSYENLTTFKNLW